jgi:hypothetical protein
VSSRACPGGPGLIEREREEREKRRQAEEEPNESKRSGRLMSVVNGKTEERPKLQRAGVVVHVTRTNPGQEAMSAPGLDHSPCCPAR